MTRARRFSEVNICKVIADAMESMVEVVDAPIQQATDFVAEYYEKHINCLLDSDGYPVSEERLSFLQEKHSCDRLAAYRIYLDEQEQIYQDNVKWLADPANRDSEIYSDVYKDTYGVRPRW